ncbi:GNAT family N-acetyltransferase [Yoonia sp. 208BN28-4]|uniref:GNAT family N-acetyltransferase n=1 Tax=Yoonia sp. 208BN28-4 TaxID=3126505 RepID=UPI0030A99A86
MTDSAFRPAVAADVPAIAAMWHTGWADGHAAIVPDDLIALRTYDSFETRTRAHLDDAIVNDDVTAMAMICDDQLYQFYVSASARGTGLAKALMQEAERRMRNAGVTTAWLACSVGNDRAARFYEKAGWIHTATEDLQVETLGAPYTLQVWRYEKALTSASA